MSDEFANDDVKLITYVIVSLARGSERVLPASTNVTIITENLSEKDFIAGAVAQYLQSNAYALLKPDEKLKDEELKYLFVDYTVKSRWARQPLKFEEGQIEELENINDAISALLEQYKM